MNPRAAHNLNALRERIASWATRHHLDELRANVRRFLGKAPSTEEEARRAMATTQGADLVFESRDQRFAEGIRAAIGGVERDLCVDDVAVYNARLVRSAVCVDLQRLRFRRRKFECISVKVERGV